MHDGIVVGNEDFIGVFMLFHEEASFSAFIGE